MLSTNRNSNSKISYNPITYKPMYIPYYRSHSGQHPLVLPSMYEVDVRANYVQLDMFTLTRRFQTQFFVAFLPKAPSSGFSSGVKQERIPKHGWYPSSSSAINNRLIHRSYRWRSRSHRGAFRASEKSSGRMSRREDQRDASAILYHVYSSGHSARRRKHSGSTKESRDSLSG